MLIIAIVLITLALIFYTTGVWAEKLGGRLKRWHAGAFLAGLAFDAIAIPTMPIASPTTPMTKVITHQPSPWRCSFMSVLLYSGLDPT